MYISNIVWGLFLKILADKDIFFINRLFDMDNEIRVCDGRDISTQDLKNIDVLIIRSVTKVNRKLLYNNLPKFVGTTTAGIDHIDQNYLKKNDVKFSYAPGSNAIAVVEYVLTSLFWLAQRNNFFLRDKTVGIVGVGHIGSLLYYRLNSFGIHTLLYDPYVSKIDPNKNWKSFETLVSESDILTFHTSLTYTGNHSTWHMVNKDVLDALPTNAVLVNTARGEVIDNTALLKVLQCGKKINIILDVWESEPYLLFPLLDYVDIGTAHIAGFTLESKIRSIMSIYNEYCNYFNIIKKVDLFNLISCSFNYVQINKLDEVWINKLMQFIYDIYQDHIALKNCAIHLGEFDLLRKYHYNRREWSTLCVKTGQSYTEEILAKLGFGIF